MRKKYVTLVTLWFIAVCPVLSMSQSGGIFVMQKSVIASGGSQTAGGVFSLDGTVGQKDAGATSSGGIFQVDGGFWSSTTASPILNVSISGRVFTSNGVTGLRNASVTLTDSLGAVRSVTTSPFGFYSFDNVLTGSLYTLRVGSRLYRFQPQVVTPNGDLTDVNFVGLE